MHCATSDTPSAMPVIGMCGLIDAALLFHEGSTLLVLVNALRLLA